MILNQVFGNRPGSVMLILCALASMNDMSAPSVSLEGKNLWLIQSLPITPWQVLRAKLLLHAGLTGIPMLFCVICMAVTGICPWEQLLLSFALGLGYLLLMALSGLFLVMGMVVFIYFSSEKKITKLHRTFSMLLVTVLVYLAFDGITVYTVNHLDTVPPLLNNLAHRVFNRNSS